MSNDGNRSIYVTIENGIDMFLNLVSMIIAYLFCATVIGSDIVDVQSPSALFFIFVVIMLQSFVSISVNLYKPLPFRKTYSILIKIIETTLFYYLVVELFVILIFRGELREFYVFWVLSGFVVSTSFLLFKKNLMIHITGKMRRRRYNLRKVIIVGDNDATVSDFIKQVSQNTQYGMMIIGYVGDKLHDHVGCEKLGSFKDLGAILDEHRPSDVVFAIDAYDKRHLIKLVNLCDDRCIRVFFLPVIYGFFKSAKQILSIGNMPVINIHTTPLDNRANAFVKRLIDIIGSLCLIILTAPIMLVAAIAVYISSPGPILFKQERVGKMGKPFTMLKFRSMRVNVESDEAWTTQNDPRKTKVGAFLRKTSIDELPQLFNVFVGSMSLVGPRPEIPKFVDYFRETIPLYMVKHYVKPGLTGLAQVRGLRGDTSVEDRIHADIEYIENWSLIMDIGILLKTPFKAISKNENYRVSKNFDELPVLTEEQEKEFMLSHATPEQAFYEGHTDSRKGKILYAASTMSHINNFHLQYIDSLKEEGYTVKIMARGEGADYNIPFEKKFFSSSNTACRHQIKRIIARERFDYIVTNTSLAAFHIRYSLPRNKRPHVVNIVHGYLFAEKSYKPKSLLLLFCEKLLAKRTDTIIVMNKEDERIAKKHKLCRGGIYYCRGMGAKVREPITATEKIRRELLCQDKFVMTFVGELSDRKNQEFLISSLNEVKERIPNAVLWLVGDGVAKDSLVSLAGRIDLSESVFFLGKREDACDCMRASNLYVSASTIEGMPFNIIEAMGCGKTVLASRVKGHSDLIDDGETGFLFKPGSTQEFARKVEAIYKGELSVDPADVLARYKEFANERVFSETYALLKGALEEKIEG